MPTSTDQPDDLRLLVDSPGHVVGDPTNCIFWDGRDESRGGRSLLNYIETHDSRLKEKYCSFIAQMGEARIDGVCLREHLNDQDGFSYWWMSTLLEKSVWKSPGIKDAIRYFALEEILLNEKVGRLRIVSANPKFGEVLRPLCESRGIALEWRSTKAKHRSKWTVRSFFNSLPIAAQAILALGRHVIRRSKFGSGKRKPWVAGPDSMVIVSYFAHLDLEAAKQGQFISRYWGNLLEHLRKKQYDVNWIHHFSPHPMISNAGAADTLLGRINAHSGSHQSHIFLDQHLSYSVVVGVLRRWIRLRTLITRIKNPSALFQYDEYLSLWPVLKDDWHSSFGGVESIRSFLFLELFERAMSSLPHQKVGIYLCENQAWERAFLHAWRKHGHGKIIAVPHSTRSFWDLRFFRLSEESGQYCNRPPEPDLTAVNGRAAMKEFFRDNYRKDEVFGCEALRYGYLNESRLKKSTRNKQQDDEGLRVLILGDFTEAGTLQLLGLIRSALPYIAATVHFVLKPHPSYCPPEGRAEVQGISITQKFIGEILHEYDIALSANQTSAAVDAFLAGLPVVVMLDPAELNMSPLRGHPGVQFVATGRELAEAIGRRDELPIPKDERNEFFYLDPSLPRWRSLLSESF